VGKRSCFIRVQEKKTAGGGCSGGAKRWGTGKPWGGQRVWQKKKNPPENETKRFLRQEEIGDEPKQENPGKQRPADKEGSTGFSKSLEHCWKRKYSEATEKGERIGALKREGEAGRIEKGERNEFFQEFKDEKTPTSKYCVKKKGGLKEKGKSSKQHPTAGKLTKGHCKLEERGKAQPWKEERRLEIGKRMKRVLWGGGKKWGERKWSKMHSRKKRVERHGGEGGEGKWGR